MICLQLPACVDRLPVRGRTNAKLPRPSGSCVLNRWLKGKGSNWRQSCHGSMQLLFESSLQPVLIPADLHPLHRLFWFKFKTLEIQRRCYCLGLLVFQFLSDCRAVFICPSWWKACDNTQSKAGWRLWAIIGYRIVQCEYLFIHLSSSTLKKTKYSLFSKALNNKIRSCNVQKTWSLYFVHEFNHLKDKKLHWYRKE